MLWAESGAKAPVALRSDGSMLSRCLAGVSLATTATGIKLRNGMPDVMNIRADGALPFETDDGEPRDQIARLEAQLDELAGEMERCRKIRLISQVAIAAGSAWLLAITVGVIGFDPIGLMAAISGVIGGTVMYGSNTTTSREVEAAIKNAEAMRAALIGSRES